MTLTTTMMTRGMTLGEADRRHIEHQVRSLERRLLHHPEPQATLVIEWHAPQRRTDVDLRVQLGPLGSVLVSKQAAESADHAVRLAVADIERQIERRHAHQRGEHTFGVPSRRLPKATRPGLAGGTEEAAQQEED